MAAAVVVAVEAVDSVAVAAAVDFVNLTWVHRIV